MCNFMNTHARGRDPREEGRRNRARRTYHRLGIDLIEPETPAGNHQSQPRVSIRASKMWYEREKVQDLGRNWDGEA